MRDNTQSLWPMDLVPELCVIVRQLIPANVF